MKSDNDYEVELYGEVTSIGVSLMHELDRLTKDPFLTVLVLLMTGEAQLQQIVDRAETGLTADQKAAKEQMVRSLDSLNSALWKATVQTRKKADNLD